MQRLAFLALIILTVTLSGSRDASAHCEVPCGIYADQMRFEQMLEDHATIAKAMAKIRALEAPKSAQDLNQAVRWVNTKEDHATKTQHVIAQYFMAQRIKPVDDLATEAGKKYVAQLTAAHKVTVAAMKCKQGVKDEQAAALKNAILELYTAYTGKQPKTHEHKGEHK